MRGRARAGLLALLVAAVVTGAAPSAHAVTADEPPPRLLWLTPDADGQVLGSLSPGESVYWQVGAHLEGPEWGALVVQLASWGDLVDHRSGLLVDVRACPVEWAAAPPACPGGARVILPRQRLADVDPATTAAVGTITPERSHWLLVAFTMPADAPDDLQGSRAVIGVGLTASGDDATPAPPALARTGAQLLPAVLLALGAVGAGLLLAGAARRRSR